MLEFILGGAGTGKTARLEQIIADLTAQEQQILLLVPDQMTFETERRLQQILPPASFARVAVYSFKRLCREIFRRCGGLAGQYADDVAKQAIMHLALCEVRDALTVYRRYAASVRFVPRALDMVTELKNAAVTPEVFSERIAAITQPELKRKTEDIALIYQTYHAMLSRTFLDPLDDISRAAALLGESACLTEQVVMLDGFTGFTEAQYRMLSVLLRQAETVYVTLCYAYGSAGAGGIFRGSADTYRHLQRLAAPYHPPKEPTVLSDPTHFQDDALRHLSLHALRAVTPLYEGDGNGVQLVLAPNGHEEVRYVLATIRSLVQDGLRYRDIAVACRDPEQYLSVFRHMAGRYDVPCFFDERRSILHEPLVCFLIALLELVQKKQSAMALLRMLRCGLLPYTVEEVSALENYLYLWNIRGEGIFSPFYANPAGFAEELSEKNAALLARLEQMRQELTAPVLTLRRLTQGDGMAFCRALFGAIEDYGLPDALRQAYERRCAAGEQIEAQDSARVYPQVLELLDTLAATLTDQALGWNRFAELFSLGLNQMDLGERPQRMDAVSFSDISRMRLTGPKVLFLLGVNEGELPHLPAGNSLLTESERSQLFALSLALGDNMEDRMLAERFSAYCAVSAPSQRIYLLAKRTAFSGETAQPSELFTAARRMFTDNILIETEKLPPVYFCRTEKSTADTLAAHYRENTSEIASFYAALRERPAWSGWLTGIHRAVEPDGFAMTDPNVSSALFGRRMRLSPTRVEQFQSCAFAYFCKYGLRARPRDRAELNPLETGTLIHDLLHSLVAREDFLTLPSAPLKELIAGLLNDYIDTHMGGAEDKTARFNHLVRRMERTVYQVAVQLQEEFRHSQFRPIAFELPVGQNGSPVGGLEFTDDRGGSAILCGTIDRVDSFVLDGITYMRVVDYKSGKQKFVLSELYDGLNLQMLFYLFAIWKKGTGQFAEITPAGVLYLPSKDADGSLPRTASGEEVAQTRAEQYRMSGLLLDEPAILRAMETGTQGIFLPVKSKEDGTFAASDSLCSLQQLGKLYQHAMRILEQMYLSLQEGKVAPLPAVSSTKNPCDYCDYRTVCGFEEGSPIRELHRIKRDDFYRLLDEEVQDGNDMD